MFHRLLLLMILLAAAGPGTAQVGEDADTGQPSTGESEADARRDPLGRETPLGTALGFLEAADRQDWEEAAQFLDLRYLQGPAAGMSGAELARLLDLIVTRNARIDLGGVSDRPEGHQNDGLPAYRDSAATLDLPGGPVDLWLQRVPGELSDQQLWKLSNASVSRLPEVAEYYRYPDWVEAFRKGFPFGGAFLGMASWKWALSLLLVGAAWPIVWLLMVAAARVFSRPGRPIYPEVRGILTGPVLTLVLLIAFAQIMRSLGMGLTAQKVASGYTLITAISVWLVFKLITLVQTLRRLGFEAAGRSDAAVLGRPIARALKLVVLVVAVLFWLSNLGVNITTMLAGLGIGGLAFALAMQKPIEDLLGAISLYSQRQIETGDLVRYRDTIATVEEIGLRTTRLRTLQNTVVSVPNLRLAYEDLENISARQRIMYEQLLRLRVDTTPAQLRAITADLETMLRDHERVPDDVRRVHFRRYGEYALEITLQAFIQTTAFDEYLAVCQELNVRALEIVHRHGARLATPEGGFA